MSDVNGTSAVRLSRLGTILVEGVDRRAFLQGQLSADLDRLTPEQAVPASCNSAQGRVQAVVWLVERADALVMILPSSMIEPTLARLRKYVLRSKVELGSGAGKLDAYATFDGAAGNLPPALRAHAQVGTTSYIRWPPDGQRVLILSPQTLSSVHDPNAESAWQLDDIRAGLPQVYPQTHETFVAQMLNLDLLGGIDYEKGCYTGQEIIARTHFRGTIKRRMLRFASSTSPPPPGARVTRRRPARGRCRRRNCHSIRLRAAGSGESQPVRCAARDRGSARESVGENGVAVSRHE